MTANATGVFLAALETVFNLYYSVVNVVNVITFEKEERVDNACNRLLVFTRRSKTSPKFSL